jgi:hypothetical protein
MSYGETFSTAIKQRLGQLLALLGLAVLFYVLGNFLVPGTSFEAADQISQKASLHKGDDWTKFKQEVVQDLEDLEFLAELREILLHLGNAFLVAIIIVIAFDMQSDFEAKKRLDTFAADAKKLLEQHLAMDSHGRGYR